MSRLDRIAELSDRAIGAVSPGWAVRRAVRRRNLAALHLFGSGGYDAAREDRSTRGRQTRAGSADADTIPDLPKLRADSRDLIRNEPLAGGAVNTVVTSVVGTGLRLKASIDRDILGLSQEQANAWERRTEQVWSFHAARLDITRQQSFAELCDLVLRTQLASGDILSVRRMVERPGDLLGTRVQLFEADRISTPTGRESDERIVDGVESDEHGAPVRYHVSNRYPHDPTVRVEQWIPVPAFGTSTGLRQASLIYAKTRPGLSRGVPFLAPVSGSLGTLKKYRKAELDAAVVSACFTVFTRTEGALGLANQRAATPDGQEGPESREHDFALAPAAILDLEPGETIEQANPLRPNQAFEPFVLAIVRQVGVQLEIPYEVLIKHFTASYSAARAAILEAWRFFLKRRAWLASQFCDLVYEWTLTEAIARGVIVAPGFFEDPLRRMAWLGAEWTGDSMGQVNPKDETDAAKMRIDLGASTHTREAAHLTGTDWERNHERLAYEKKRRIADGLDVEAVAERIATEPKAPPPAAPGGNDVPDEKDRA